MSKNVMIDELLRRQLRELFFYNADNGNLIWRSAASRKKGRRAGAIDSKGRLRIEIKGKTYAAHHIIFAMHYGRWPAEQVDHINQNKLDNRICNLREATNAQNSRNRKNKTQNNSGYKGVSLHKGRYIARIMKGGKVHNLGSFNNPQSAAKEYDKAAIQLHGEFACLNN